MTIAAKLISPARMKTISKHLSYVLRHRPDSIGLVLDASGWASVDDLLARSTRHGLSLRILKEVVADNDKQRFTFSDDGTRIRANQGHSIEIDLNLQAQQPPDVLLHGTAQRFLAAILQQGLDKRNRHHVHLTTDAAVATKVGMRYGKLVMLTIDARAMHDQGMVFYQSKNGVWLTDRVPPQFLQVQA